MNTEGSNWGTQVKASSRGLTYDDINRPRCYGTIPEKAEYRNMTPRGSVREPYRDRLPDLPEFRLVEKWDVWSDNVCTLYEEAKFRQWRHCPRVRRDPRAHAVGEIVHFRKRLAAKKTVD